jgi:alpha-ribazole phosphatase/probable phosphoglycerate mutase
VAVSLVYETHSLTTDNDAGIATGWLPGKLSDEGRRLAARLGERRRDDGISAVFVSDLARARETVSVAFKGHHMMVSKDARLRECDYGDLNGCSVAVLQLKRRKHILVPFPRGESYQDVVERTRAFLADIALSFDRRRVLVVAHSANKWALDVLLRGARLEDLVDADFGWQEGWEYEVG